MKKRMKSTQFLRKIVFSKITIKPILLFSSFIFQSMVFAGTPSTAFGPSANPWHPIYILQAGFVTNININNSTCTQFATTSSTCVPPYTPVLHVTPFQAQTTNASIGLFYLGVDYTSSCTGTNYLSPGVANATGGYNLYASMLAIKGSDNQYQNFQINWVVYCCLSISGNTCQVG